MYIAKTFLSLEHFKQILNVFSSFEAYTKPQLFEVFRSSHFPAAESSHIIYKVRCKVYHLTYSNNLHLITSESHASSD